MNINEFKEWDMDLAQAYTIGLIYPLFKYKKINGKFYIIGSVNHNSNTITKEEIDDHFLKVNKLLNASDYKTKPIIKANRYNGISISHKEGFSILIDALDYTEQDILNILNEKVDIIINSNRSIRKQFVRGCFDGRSSWDKTANYLSIDVDRDNERKSKIEKIILSLDIEVNINNRGENHPKNDQIRIKPNSIEKFLKVVGLYSIRRLRNIDGGLRR